MSTTNLLRRALATAAFVGVAIPGVLATSASASAWEPHVRLQGTSICASSATTWVWVEASNGERGWATNGRGRYSFDFWNVPRGKSISVKVNYGNGTFACTDTVGVSRPTFGATATRDLFKLTFNA
jgi:hypothetical protein